MVYHELSMLYCDKLFSYASKPRVTVSPNHRVRLSVATYNS